MLENLLQKYRLYNCIAVVVLQLVNQATCFGLFVRSSSGLQSKRPKHVA